MKNPSLVSEFELVFQNSHVVKAGVMHYTLYVKRNTRTRRSL